MSDSEMATTTTRDLLDELNNIGDQPTLDPRIQELVNEVTQLRALVREQAAQQAELGQLRQEITTLRAGANIVNTLVLNREYVKLNTPETYDGTAGQLQAHLTQVRAY